MSRMHSPNDKRSHIHGSPTVIIIIYIRMIKYIYTSCIIIVSGANRAQMLTIDNNYLYMYLHKCIYIYKQQ